MSALIPVVVIVAIIALTIVVSAPRFLLGRVKSKLESGEQVVFESRASRMKVGWPPFFGLNRGAIVISDRRLLFGVWLVPPFWLLRDNIRLDEVEEVLSGERTPTGAVELHVQGKRLYFAATSAFMSFPNYERSLVLADAISRGRLTHA